MKIIDYTLLLFFCFFYSTAYCQTGVSESCIGKLYYSFSHKYDSSVNSDSRFKETVVLSYGKNISVYQSLDRLISEKKDAQQKSETLPNGISRSSLSAFGSMDNYYYLPQKKEIQRIRSFGVPPLLYSMLDKNISINWKIEPEIKQIGNYSCQKASTNFRGRNWTAWFCNDIPFGYGPWKLVGLPGLILEAYDQNHEVEFLYKNIEKALPNTLIVVANETIVTDEVNFEKIRQAFYDNMAFSSGGVVTASGSLNSNSNNNSTKASTKFNNPIDLVSKALRRPYWY